MYKTTLILIAIISSNIQSVQKIEIEDLVNQVYNEIVPQNFKFYNLIDSSFITKFDKYSLEKDELILLRKKFPDFPVDSFIQKSKICTAKDWNLYDLKNARVYSYDSIPKFESGILLSKIVPYNIAKEELDSLNKNKEFNQIILPAKWHWREKRIDKELQKAWNKYSNSVQTENRIFYKFSTPLIIDNYAIITLNRGGGGASYIFRKTDGVWRRILIFRRWVS